MKLVRKSIQMDVLAKNIGCPTILVDCDISLSEVPSMIDYNQIASTPPTKWIHEQKDLFIHNVRFSL